MKMPSPSLQSIGAPNAPYGIDFFAVPEPKRSKNRLHLDLNATDRDQDAELRRLLDLGARPVDQPLEGWPNNHSNLVVFDENALPIGAALYAAFALDAPAS